MTDAMPGHARARRAGLRWAAACVLLAPQAGVLAGQLTLDPAIVVGRRWAEGASQFRQQLLDLAKARELPEARQLADVYARYSLCNLLAASRDVDLAPDEQGHDLIDWLLGNPTLAGTLALAVRPEDNPAGVLSVLRILMLASKRQKVSAPDLYVAFAVVWDDRVLRAPVTRPYTPGGTARRGWRGERPQDTYAPGEILLRLFTHFARHSERMATDLAKLPWQLAVFVVDSDIAEDEREWALERYARIRSFGGLYGQVRYDIEHSKWEPGAPYTLENIRRWGGVCSDRAYFAANIAKACGRPAAIVSGATRIGVGHAWVIILYGETNARYRWNIYGWSTKEPGDYTDPQTGRRMAIQEAELQARALQTPYLNRLTADTFCRVAELLKKDLEVSRTLDLIEQAARNNPYDIRTWLMLARMMGEGQVPSDRATALYNFLLDRFKAYPEFTRDILHALLPLIPEDKPEELCRLYDATFKVYRDSPDIVADLMMELGDFLRERNLPVAALTTYRRLIWLYRAQAHLVENAFTAAEAIYRQKGLIPEIIDMYEEVFHIYRKQKGDALFYGKGTYYYRFAQKLAALYREAGNLDKALQYARLVARIDDAMEDRDRRARERGHK